MKHVIRAQQAEMAGVRAANGARQHEQNVGARMTERFGQTIARRAKAAADVWREFPTKH